MRSRWEHVLDNDPAYNPNLSLDREYQFQLAAPPRTAFASGASAEDFLPLQRGYYVNSDTPCEQASNATLNLFRGVQGLTRWGRGEA